MLGVSALAQVAIAQFPPVTTTATSFPISGLNWRNMQLLATNIVETIYWDFSDTENFYSLIGNTLYHVSPKYVYTWFTLNPSTAPNVTITYNPFLGAFQNQFQNISDII